MTTVETLIAAKAKIDAPEKWTQGHIARNVMNQSVNARSKDAARWCAMGAIDSTATAGEPSNAAFGALRSAIGDKGIAGWNDSPFRTHAEVMEAFDKAIALAQLQEAA